MKHVVITRLLYKEDDRLLKRLELYKKYCLDSLKKQTKTDFDIAVLCNRDHSKIFKDMGIIPFHFKDNWFGQKPKKYWSCFRGWDNVEGLDMYDIQTSLDSDDFVAPNYLETIENTIDREAEGSLHVHFQPRFFNIATGEDLPQKKQYSEETGSAFYSLYQPDKTNYVYCGHDSHLRIGKLMDKSILIKEGYCWIGVHDDNDSTRIR